MSESNQRFKFSLTRILKELVGVASERKPQSFLSSSSSSFLLRLYTNYLPRTKKKTRNFILREKAKKRRISENPPRVITVSWVTSSLLG